MKKLRQRAYEWLRWSEKYTKTDMVYAVRGSFWLSGSQIITAIASLALATAFANFISQETYGTYKYILSIAGALSVFTLSGISIATTRAVARGHEGEFLKSVKTNFRWELILTVASFIGATYYYFRGNITLALCLLIIGIFSPVKDSAELYPTFLAGKKDFRAIGILSQARTLLSTLWLFVTILFVKSPVAIVFSYFVVNTIVPSIFAWWVVRTKKPNQSTEDGTFRLAMHTSFMKNYGGLFDQLDTVLIFHLLGPIQVAVYNFAQAIPEYLAGFIKNIGTLAIPKFADSKGNNILKTMRQKSFRIFLVGATMAVIYILVVPTFFQIFFPKYLASVKYSQVYSLILIFSSVLQVAYLDSRVAIKEKYVLSFWSNTIGIALVGGGIFYFGIWGAILARIISKAFGVGLAYYLTARFGAKDT